MSLVAELSHRLVPPTASPGFLHRLSSSAVFRFKRRRLGLSDAKDLPSSLGARIAGKNVSLKFPTEERQLFAHEFHKIFIEDCYGLDHLPSKIGSVLDIGANLGLFSLAARHHFPQATIHAYEPNQQLEPFLRSNLQPFQIDSYIEALGSSKGQVRLLLKENSLHTVAAADPHGDVTQINLEEAVSRVGGRVGLLKLDCEGAEWSLFHSTSVWPNIERLTMEYHLWAKPQAGLADLTEIIRKLGFTKLQVFPSMNSSFGILWAGRE